MHIWYLRYWEKYIDIKKDGHKSGIYLRFDKDVDRTVREFCMNFAKWLRKEFFFPTRLNVYIKSEYRIKAKDGELVVGTFWRPNDMSEYPYMRMATGDYFELIKTRGREQAMWAILRTFTHELTHYFQYINKLNLTPIGIERQAKAYTDYILCDYCDYLEENDPEYYNKIQQM